MGVFVVVGLQEIKILTYLDLKPTFLSLLPWVKLIFRFPLVSEINILAVIIFNVKSAF